MPPGPTIVTRRSRDSRETSAGTASSRPIIRVAASGRLCEAIGATIGGSRGDDEIVAPSWDGDDVATARLTVAEGPAQSTDLNLQIRFFDERLWPGSSD